VRTRRVSDASPSVWPGARGETPAQRTLPKLRGSALECGSGAQVPRRFCRHETSWHSFSRRLCMTRGRKTSLTIHLTPAQRQTLLALQRSTGVPAGVARRSRIILLLADRVTITDIATKVGMSRQKVYKWIQRFVQEGVEGLTDRNAARHRSEPRFPKRQDHDDIDMVF
jgi:biotin operon repressor